MGNKSRQGPPRQPRPVNPSQQELQIMHRMMEEAIATRVRVEDSARVLQGQLNEHRLLLAGALLLQENQTLVLTDAMLAELDQFAGFDVDRDDEAGSLTIRLIPADLEDEEE